MWRNPNYPQPEQRPPPEPSGRPLATLERPGGRFGPPTQLRVSLDAFEGHPFVSVRLWTRGPDGRFYPSRKGCSVRIGEAEAVAEAVAAALVEAARIADQDHPRPGPTADRRGPRREERRPARSGHRPPAQRGQAPEYEPDFDECR